MSMMSFVRRNCVIPLWVWKDGSPRLAYQKEMERTQWLDPTRLKELQFKRLQDMIRYAYNEVPLYRMRFDEQGLRPEHIKDFYDIKRIPLLTKQDLRDHPLGFIAEGRKASDLIPFKTGGSTGKAVTVYYNFDSMERGVGAALRSFRWTGWNQGEPVGRVWGNPHLPATLKEKLRNALIAPEIYLDTMRLDEHSVKAFVAQWRELRPTLLHGHSHSLYMLATYCQRLGITDIKPKGIVSTSMMLIPSERRIVEEVFCCPVTDLYGSEEVSLIACECEQHHGMHINMENNYVEIVDATGQPVPAGQEGAIVITNLLNKAMPLIRYKIEDMGVMSERTCPCGRGLPLLEKVHGRIADFLVRKDGSLVAGVSLVERTLTAFSGIQQMQIMQNDLDTIILNIVRDEDYGKNTEQLLVSEFSDVFGPSVKIIFNYISSLAAEKNGKHRFSISKLESKYSVLQ